ncbi:MAG: protein kinase [Gemmataceae bacterium]|nr:protein kinase [Gemmataceae bacterium]
MKPDTLATFVEALRESRLLEPTQLSELEKLQSNCTEPKTLASELIERGSLTEFQVAQILDGDGKSLNLGQYTLLELLGEGGMGQVYKARHQRMKRVVALKVIRKDIQAGTQAIQRFNKEIEAAAALSHPNVVIAYDANEVDDTLFFVMEYVEGIDLGRLVAKFGPAPVGHACEFVRQAALGLQHAHERGMVHRDIKPSNLLLTYHGAIVKILDMGLARLSQSVNDQSGHLTRTGVVMGTPDFISPEQARDSHTADIRSDLYSLGCTLYFLLSGQVPFPEGSFTEKLLKHNMDQPAPLEKMRPEVPADVIGIVAKLLAKRADDRYQTPAELAEALAPFSEKLASAECYRPKATDILSGGANSDNLATAAINHQQTPGRPMSSSTGGKTESRTGVLPESVPGAAAKWDTIQPQRGAALANAGLLEASQIQVPGVPAPAPQRRSNNLVRVAIAMVLGVACAVVVALLAFPPSKTAETGSLANLSTNPDTGDLGKTSKPGSEPDTGKGPPTTRSVPTTKKDPPETKKDPPEIVKEKPWEPRQLIWKTPGGDKKKDTPWQGALAPGGLFGVSGWSKPLKKTANDLYAPDPAHVYLCNLAKTTSEESRYASHLLNRYVSPLAISRDGAIVVFGTIDEFIQPPKDKGPVVFALGVWDTVSGNVAVLMDDGKEEKEAMVTSIAIDAEGHRALVGSVDGTVSLWDLRDLGTVSKRKKMHSHRAHDKSVTALAFDRGGSRALSGSSDHKVILWDVDRFKTIGNPFAEHESSIASVAISPQGNYGLSGDRDGKLYLWDLKGDSRKALRLYSGYETEVAITSLAFAPTDSKTDDPDQLLFLSGSTDRSVRLWRVSSTTHRTAYTEHNSGVLSVTFSPDAKYAIFICNDGTYRSRALPATTP